jgi:hypothetical protein
MFGKDISKLIDIESIAPNHSNRSKSSKELYTTQGQDFPSNPPSSFKGINGTTVTEQPNQTARELQFD